MCGRYTLAKKPEVIAQRFDASLEKDTFRETFNAAPTQVLPVISNNNPETIRYFKWGLIPFWAKDASIGNKMINARAETLKEKPAFRKSLQQKRCLVIADGFYEWKKEGKTKQPFRITLKDNGLFAFAGLWDEWKDDKGNKVQSFTIITTDPNELMAPIHNRMPVILPPAQEKHWLSNDLNPDEAMDLLVPYNAADMEAYPVSTLVNSPANNIKELLDSLEKGAGAS
ncbi:SOS response-associated peptidase [Rhodocytophaga aerolata]|uniref:Abasic site processing protein n=1 Tax=Rhodocytophaga aerolata TaxID=455078 RepID=A0ABT8RGE4_9BACT|nr:SOS response-associated peptidase [Rhodocytophaga aerolata]MDO1451173.1 SOS response-associated peptidase [Rhodocytophaga aerolata]